MTNQNNQNKIMIKAMSVKVERGGDFYNRYAN